jgi:hypothetical protein
MNGAVMTVAFVLAIVTYVIYLGVYLLLHKVAGVDQILSVGAGIVAAVYFMMPKGPAE